MNGDERKRRRYGSPGRGRVGRVGDYDINVMGVIVIPFRGNILWFGTAKRDYGTF